MPGKFKCAKSAAFEGVGAVLDCDMPQLKHDLLYLVAVNVPRCQGLAPVYLAAAV